VLNVVDRIGTRDRRRIATSPLRTAGPASSPVGHETRPRRAAADIALIALILCAVAGIVLTASVEPREPCRSIAEWLLANPAAILARNVHYWAAQIAVVADRWRGAQRVAPATSTHVPRACDAMQASMKAIVWAPSSMRG